MKPIVSKKARNAARGEMCTFNIFDVCNYNPETTVFCHITENSGRGIGQKPSDTSAAFGCSSCHDALDRRVWSQELEDHRDMYCRRAQARTLDRLVELGIVKYL